MATPGFSDFRNLLAARPTLAEARLITDKLASDPVYVATLADELRRIDAAIGAHEEHCHCEPPCAVVPNGDSIQWLHEKSTELGKRLRCMEHRLREKSVSTRDTSERRRSSSSTRAARYII